MPLGCEMISQPPIPLYENFRSYETPLWHTSAISQTPPPSFRIYEMVAKSSMPKNPHFRSQAPISQVVSQLCTLISQLRNGCENALLYEIHPPLRNCPSAAKMKSVPWHPFQTL